MRIKAVVKYFLSEIKTAVVIYYLIMLAVTTLIGYSIILTAGHGKSFVGGGEMASLIFLFVVGLSSFKQNFLFLSTNNVPRRTQFKGFLLAALILCVAMAFIDTTYSIIAVQFMDYRSAFYQMYGEWYIRTFILVKIAVNFLYNFALYLLSYLGGYFITNLYFRMNKMLKIIVSIGVPAIFTIILPALESAVTKGRIFSFLGDVLLVLSGLKDGVNPYIAILSLTGGAAVASGLCFLLLRRAVVRK